MEHSRTSKLNGKHLESSIGEDQKLLAALTHCSVFLTPNASNNRGS